MLDCNCKFWSILQLWFTFICLSNFRGKTRNESSLENVRNYKDIQREEGRNKLNNYLKNIRSLRIFTRTSRSHSTSDLYHEKSSGCYGSPISVESFDLDWPRSPHQPGVDLRANDGYISPISQFHASGDARIFREEFCGKIVDDRVRSNSKFHSFLGQHLLAKRLFNDYFLFLLYFILNWLI